MALSPFRRFVGRVAVGALALAVPVAMTPVAAAAAAPTDLFISEYVEGSSFNKAIEIYNGTAAPVNLSGYTLQVFFNGATAATTTIPLTGTVAAGDVHVVADNDSAADLLARTDQTTTASLFNGDDSIALRNGTTVLDVIGQIGLDPGAAWGSSPTSTLDATLRRKTAVSAGDTNGANAFDPSLEWEGFPQNAFDGLGSHAAGPVEPPPADTCDTVSTPVYDIQGPGAASSLLGKSVLVEGVVVGEFQDGLRDSIFVQDAQGDGNAATSDGIYVSFDAESVQIGQTVRVRGTVSEFSGLTQLSNVSSVFACGDTVTDIPPTELTLPGQSVGDFEAYEGMLVAFAQDLVISEYFNYDRFGEMVLTDERQFTPTAVVEPGPLAIALAAQQSLGRITLDDGRSAQNPDPALHPNGEQFTLDNRFRGGDTLTNVTGVMDFQFGFYRIQPTQGADYTSVNPRPAVPDVSDGSLKVASFNVLNYFTTPAPAGRGADNEAELVRQEDKIVAAMEEIDADVFGLMEIENNDLAIQRLVAALNEKVGAGTYDYIDTGKVGTDAIKVAFLYKPTTVTRVGGYETLDEGDDPRFDTRRNRPALAQTFQEKATDEVVTVAVNHLKSKGSACTGDPNAGDGSGNCNITRTEAAKALVDWLAQDPTGSGTDKNLIIGDLNSYDKEDPIDAILAGGYTDLVAEFGGEFAYGYVFDGKVGYLDHALASASLADEVTGAGEWHINADEPDLIDYDLTFKKPAQDALYAPDPYRSSDHDAVIVGLALDSIAPELSVTLTPDVLAPPNHKYSTVKATLTATDNSGVAPTVELVSVTSNEPDNGEDDGETVDDIVVVDDTTFKLRAERSGVGTGRIYTVTYTATDSAGNVTTETATVTVPISRGR